MTKEEKLLGFLKSPQYKPMTADEIKVSLNVNKADEDYFFSLLDTLLKEGRLLKNKKGRYKATDTDVKTGVLSLVKTGGFVKTDDEEIFVPEDNLNGAFLNDTVRVKVTKEKAKDKCAEGEIVSVLKRGLKTIVGTFVRDGFSISFVPFEKSLSFVNFSINRDNSLSLKDGDYIEADILKYPYKNAPCVVRFKEKIAEKNSFGADTSCLLRIFDIPNEFSAEAKSEAENIPDTVSEDEISKREDFREFNVITIDGEDARDLDDAIYLTREDKKFILYVHIADVSSYVKFNSPIDKDARRRGTSVYFPDRVVPMLPKELSNGICSLNEGVDRLCLSVIMEIDLTGEFISTKIVKGVIGSKHRMTYKTVTKLLEGTLAEEEKKKYSDIHDMLFDMRELAEILQNRREKQGYISFSVPEIKFILDENGKATDVFKYEEGISNKIIEQFMLMANEAVALFGKKHRLPFVYRIHEAPDGEKATALRDILRFYNVALSGEITPVAVSEAIEKLKEKENFYAISSNVLRCMTKAMYSPDNLGHFGLGCENYLHFTSPIRRYPDLHVHRVISSFLAGESLKGQEAEKSEVAEFSTEYEIRAVEAEREADKLKACEYMKNFIGDTFEGEISSVVEFGLFVSLENGVEGFVSMNDLSDDYYVYEKDFYRLRGERKNRVLCLGDKVKIRVKHIDINLRRIDFEVTDIKKAKSAKKIIKEKQKSAVAKKVSTKKLVKRKMKRKKK